MAERIERLNAKIASYEAPYAIYKVDPADATIAADLLQKTKEAKAALKTLQKPEAENPPDPKGVDAGWKGLIDEQAELAKEADKVSKQSEVSAKKLADLKKKHEEELRRAECEADTYAKLAKEAMEKHRAVAAKLAKYKAPDQEKLDTELVEVDEEEDSDGGESAGACGKTGGGLGC